MSQSESP
jgi:calmodulin